MAVLLLSGVPASASAVHSVSGVTSFVSAAPTRSTAPAPPARGRDAASSPAAAFDLSSPGRSPAAIDLEWTNPGTTPFENYTVGEASAASGWKYSSIDVITDADTTTLAVPGISPSTDYDWEVTDNYETCFLFDCTPASEVTSPLNLTQPSVGFLNYTDLTSTSATLEWTNNATYGGSIGFDNYTIFQETNGSAPASVAVLDQQTPGSDAVNLKPDTSYSFFIETADCVNGCTSSDVSVTQSNIITLGTPRTLTVSVAAQRSTIDFGESDYFTCTPSGGESPFSYSWDFAGSGYASGSESESVSFAALGTVSVACEVTDAEPKVNDSSISVFVDPSMVVIDSANRTLADADQPVGFECSVTGGSMPYNVTWVYGDGSTSGMETGSHAYASSGSYAPACSVTDGAGVTEAPSLTVNVDPALRVTASSSSSDAAPGTPIRFLAAAFNGSGNYTSYNWTFAPGATATGTDVAHAFSVAGTYSVEVRVGDTNGMNVTATVPIEVGAINVAVQESATSVHVGVNVTFTATASGGAGGPYNYTWTFGDGTLGFGPSVTHEYTSIGSYAPRVTVTDHLGANSTTTLATISVSTPPPVAPWLTGWLILAIALVIGALIALVVLARRRSAEASAGAGTAAYVPPTDPRKVLVGAKLCSYCGASNLPLRTTCATCGKPLPWSPVQ